MTSLCLLYPCCPRVALLLHKMMLALPFSNLSLDIFEDEWIIFISIRDRSIFVKYKICLSRHTLSRQGTDYTWNPGWLRRFQQDQNKFFKDYGTGLYAFFETGHALKSSKQIFQHALSVKAYLLSVGTEKLHHAENWMSDLRSHFSLKSMPRDWEPCTRWHVPRSQQTWRSNDVANCRDIPSIRFRISLYPWLT